LKRPPTDERLRRIRERLEARRNRKSGIIATNRTLYCLPGESPQDAIERAHAEGRPGGFLVLPPPLTDEQWAASCARFQAWSLARQARVLDDNFTPARSEEIFEAYRCSLTDEPMPTS